MGPKWPARTIVPKPTALTRKPVLPRIRYFIHPPVFAPT
jgi:hypothetical protein